MRQPHPGAALQSLLRSVHEPTPAFAPEPA
jgi:hypothetical protein